MSGTSRDGIDAAIIYTDGEEASIFSEFITIPYNKETRKILSIACDNKKLNSCEVIDAEIAITIAHAEAVAQLLDKAGMKASEVDVIGFHGHTIEHDPANKFSNQIGDAEYLAQATKINVVYDFRSADISAGGQGAPLTPAFHASVFKNLESPIVILNLGGVANATWIGEKFDIKVSNFDEIAAFDVGPGCALLDDWVHSRRGWAFDPGGILAASGKVDKVILSSLMSDSYFSKLPPKSLDRDVFDLSSLSKLSDADGAATIAQFTTSAIVHSITQMPTKPKKLFVSGGGRYNKTIMLSLNACLGLPVETIESVGMDGDAIEAQAFAWLAVRSIYGLPLSYPSTTGVKAPMTGGKLVYANSN